MAVFLPTVVSTTLRITMAAAILALPLSASADITPEKDITVIEGLVNPPWKQLWDKGRMLTREGDLENAAKTYRLLLIEKPRVEAATWEYCRILFSLGKGKELTPYLDSLIEQNPYNNDYLAMAGLVALEWGEFEKSLDLLGQVYSAQPEGKRGEAALAGLVDSLIGLGRYEFAFPLMEQLYQRRPDQSGLLENLADTAQKLERTAKAREYYKLLLEDDQVSPTILPLAAEAMVTAGDRDTAALLWQKLIKSEPANLEYRKLLADYFLDNDLPAKALPHLLYLIDHLPDLPSEMLLTSGRIYFYNVGRADKALRLFERYLENMPEHFEIRTEIEAVREQISEDLLPIAENSSADQFWSDLEKITVRPEILFRKMADKLEAKKRYAAAIELLEVLLQHTKEDEKDTLLFRLASLSAKNKNKLLSYTYYNQVSEAVNRSESWYRKKLQFEKELGFDKKAYQTIRDLLKRQPDSNEFLANAIQMAGELGYEKDLDIFGKRINTDGFRKNDFRLYLTFGTALTRVGSLSKAENLYNLLLQQEWLATTEIWKLKHRVAGIYGITDLHFKEQQQYRELLAENPKDEDSALALFSSALTSGDLDGAEALINLITLPDQVGKESDSLTKMSLDTIIASAKFLEAKGEMAEAISFLREKIDILLKKGNGNGLAKKRLELETELCRLFVKSGKPAQCREVLERYSALPYTVMTVRFLENVVRNNGRLFVKSLVREARTSKSGSGSLTSLFKAADLAERFGFVKEAERVLESILMEEPDSVRAQFELARLYKRNTHWKKSYEAFNALTREYPEESYYHVTALELGIKQGQYLAVIEQTDFIEEKKSGHRLQLIRARALWGAGRFEDSLALYENILRNDVNETLQQRLTQRNIQLEKDGEDEDLFWGAFYYDLSNRLDNLNSLQGKDGFLSLIGTEGGEIVAGLYSDYRYEKLVKSEYLARKAIAEKKFIAAKKQYQKSLKQEMNPEGLKDLAKIYQRLGDYGKEAEVYSALEEQGETPPEVVESIIRNQRVRSPGIGLDYNFQEKTGRDTAIDIIRQAAGASIGFPITTKSEVTLQYHELNYKDSKENKPIDGRMISASGSWDIWELTSFEYDFGYHFLDSDGESTFLYNGRLEQGLDQNITAYLEYSQSPVDDTLESIDQAITQRQLDFGVKVEGGSGFSVGTEFTKSWFSDDNESNRFSFRSAYSFFTDYSTITFSYNFDLLENDTVGELLAPEQGGEKYYSLPYWSPEEYRVHRIDAEVRQLLKNFNLFQEDVSYCTLNFGFGLESDDNTFFSTEFDIFLEISNSFLLKGDLLYVTGSEYDERRMSASLVYRW